MPFVMDMLNNLVKGSANTGEISFNTLTQIPSGPVAFDRDNLSICFFVSSTVTKGILNWVTKFSIFNETYSIFEGSNWFVWAAG